MRATRSPGSIHWYLPLVVGLLAAAAVACGNAGTPGDNADDPPSPAASTWQPETPERTGTATPTPTTTPPASPEPEPPAGSIPPELVGAWCGGSNSAPGGHYTWTFDADGTFDAFNSSQAFSGTAVLVDSSTLTIYLTTGIQESLSIGMDDTMMGPILYLDDYSYVSGPC
jgi:hypothetical protein